MVADLLSTSGSSGESLGAAEAVSTERRAETQRNTRLRIAVAEEVGLVPLPQRTLPTNLAEAGWVQHVSRSTGMPYWYNASSGESTYENPNPGGGGGGRSCMMIVPTRSTGLKRAQERVAGQIRIIKIEQHM